MDDSLAFLENETRDRLVWTVESSLDVRTPPSFFLWAQGALQSLLPHEILLCSASGAAVRGFQTQWYSSTRYFREEHFQRTIDGSGSLLSRLMAQWGRDDKPIFQVGERLDAQQAENLRDLELRNAIAHGVRSPDGGLCGFYVLARTSMSGCARSVRILDALIPYVHVTYCRVLSTEARGGKSQTRVENTVTARELEILNWIKEGKTTTDIAEMLSLSPFTVKNHVQNIMKKLGARSRSHAVAQAIGMGILPNGSPA
jgi:transcriptional regulator EpsA